MSTPRRPAPRSRLAPISATGRRSVCALTERKLPLSEMGDAERQGIRVLLADDDRDFLQSLRELIDRQPELGVVGLAENGLEAIEQADELEPDAVVIDLHMPLVDGVTAVARPRPGHPSPLLFRPARAEGPQPHPAAQDAGPHAVPL